MATTPAGDTPAIPCYNPEWHQAAIVTDGSGHADGYGGFSVEVLWSRKGRRRVVSGLHMATDVFRMEFQALLHGLKLIADDERLWQTDTQWTLRQHRLCVWWLNDNEALVKGVQRDKTTGQPLYSRTAAPELWAQLAFYEQFLWIDAHHTPREIGAMGVVDWMASSMRTTGINFDALNDPDNLRAIYKYEPLLPP
jgi:ribonuclease HI